MVSSMGGRPGTMLLAEANQWPEDVRAYEENLMGRLVISALPDDIRRVIRQPIRKLGQEERFVGPLALCEQHGLPMGLIHP